MTVRCAVYARVSADIQADLGSSLETQEQACLAYAHERGYDVVGVYRETFSGVALHERPRLRALRDALAEGGVDVLLSYALDRLSRSQVHTAILDDECQRVGARLEFVTEVFEDTSVGRFVRGAKAFAAELEHEKIRERTTRGKLARAAAGKLSPRARPYGYRWADAEKGRLVADAGEAAVVRRLYAWVAAGGALQGVADALRAEGVPSPRGLPFWHRSTVHQLLSNPLYRGEGLYGRTVQRRERGRTVQRPRAEAEWLRLPPGVVEPLVTPAEWERARRALAANRQRATRRARRPEAFLLRGGVARCAACGGVLHALYGGAPRRDGSRYAYYRCEPPRTPWGARGTGTPGACAAPAAFPAAALDALVWRAVVGHRAAGRPRPTGGAQVAREREKRVAQLEGALRDLGRRERNVARALGLADTDGAMAPLLAEGKALASARRRVADERDALAAEAGRADGLAAGAAEAMLALGAARDRLRGLRAPGDYHEMRGWLDRLGVAVAVWRRGEPGAPPARVRVTIGERETGLA